MATVKRYEDFMKAHVVPKGATTETTNTRIPSQEHGVYGGRYHIEDEE